MDFFSITKQVNTPNSNSEIETMPSLRPMYFNQTGAFRRGTGTKVIAKNIPAFDYACERFDDNYSEYWDIEDTISRLRSKQEKLKQERKKLSEIIESFSE